MGDWSLLRWLAGFGGLLALLAVLLNHFTELTPVDVAAAPPKSPAVAAPANYGSAEAAALFKAHCVSCHGATKPKGNFDIGPLLAPDKFKDKYEAALKALVKRKAAGKTIEIPEEKAEESNVIDLMDALKQSLGRKKAATPSAKGKKRVPARRSRKRKAA